MTIQDNYDLIVVGCGFCGSAIARLAAERCGKRVLILERRNHIAGNMYDHLDENGLLIQDYGPHIFHTDEDRIAQFVCQFSKWIPSQILYGVEIDGQYVSAPFGFQSIRQMYSGEQSEKIIKCLKDNYKGCESVPVFELFSHQEKLLAAFAKDLYEKDYRPYAAKQWNLDPNELDPSVIARMPIILSDRVHYFNTKYEMLPAEGYTKFFENMLSHPLLNIRLNTDACAFLTFDYARKCIRYQEENLQIPIVFTGALSDIIEPEMPLPYRSLYFRYETLNTQSYQPVAIMTYPQTHDFIRTTEYSKFSNNVPKDKTVVAFEYSVFFQKNADVGKEPYYPILTQENIQRNAQLTQRLEVFDNLIPCGRLADYKYYNMDQAILRAFEVFSMLKQRYWS